MTRGLHRHGLIMRPPASKFSPVGASFDRNDLAEGGASVELQAFVYTESKSMGNLYRLRTGREGERLAEYLLSRFSFVAQPTTVADDVGSDFYCTIFDILETDPPTIEARTSFAIQVKTNARKIEAHNKVRHLRHLEIPFFVGVVDQTKAELKIYSAEH